MPSYVSEIANAKINVALHVLGRRSDGYHELDSVVAFADIGDELRITYSENLTLACTGPFAADLPQGGDNIVLKTWDVLHEVLCQRAFKLPKVAVELIKNLPLSSGIGGGSADAAAMLRALLKLTHQNLTSQDIKSLARTLGADVPVCFHQKSCRMQGIGENITNLEIELPQAIVLVNPQVPCSTLRVFAQLGLREGQNFKTGIDLLDPPSWRNDLLMAAQHEQPEIAKLLAALQQEPSFSAVRMSGSGATCFGLTSSLAEASSAAARLSVKNPKWWVKACSFLC